MSTLENSGNRVSRRTMLAASLGALTLTAGCSGKRPVAAVAPEITVATLISPTPFYIAHRGGGGNWPEMTAFAYEQAAKIPSIHALEISVCRSSDGVLVCSHDADTLRLTGVPYVIADQTWATLSTLMVSAAETDDPDQPSRPLSKFDDIVERYINRYVLFVEPKVLDAVEPLMSKMMSLGQPERVVWKQPINQPGFAAAKEAGFATWGYVLNERGHLGPNLERYAASPTIDMLGAQRSQTNSMVSAVTAAAARNHKRTIMWPIGNVDDRARALRLGCQGMMTSNVVDVPDAPL